MPATEPSIVSTGAFTLSELLALNVDKPQPIIEDLLFERQNGLLAGQYGIGKTILGLQLSLCVAGGVPFLGRPTKQSPVAFIDGENDIGEIKSRVSRQLAGLGLESAPNNWVYVTTKDFDTKYCGMALAGRPSDPSSSIAKLDDFIEHYKPEFILLDNLAWFVEGELDDSEAVHKYYRALRELRNRHDCLENGVVLALHHLTKPGERIPTSQSMTLLDNPREYLYRSRGSARLLDFAEARLGLAEEHDSESSYHVFNGVNRSGAQIVPAIMQLDQDTLCFEPHEDSRLVQEKVFVGHQRKLEVFNSLPDEFTYKQAASICRTKATLSGVLKMGTAAGLLKVSGRVYRKVGSLEPPVDQAHQADLGVAVSVH